MKTKFFLILVLFGLTIAPAFAQDETTEESGAYFRYGPKVGMELNADLKNISTDANVYLENLKNNYQIGVFAQLGKRLYLQPEFVYSVYNGTDSLGNATSNEFIKIPLHLGLKFFDIGLLSLHISGGAIYTQTIAEKFKFDLARISYQVGVGVDVLDFITTDIRYTLKKDKTFAEQIDNFATNGGIVNLTVGLKLK
jgi:hypothetical protein